jgi:hypothetical protein
VKKLGTVPHSGTRFVEDSLRAAGVPCRHVVQGGDERTVEWFHFNERQLPAPHETVTLLRSPILVVASHDRDQFSSLESVCSTIEYAYLNQLRYLEDGCVYAHIGADPIEKICELLGCPIVSRAEMKSIRGYPLKHELQQKRLARDLWYDVRLLDWYLDRMAHVDRAYAQLGYEIWWR